MTPNNQASASTISLTTDNLVVGYDSPIVKGVNLNIQPGKMSILIGSNGCGKSTLLKCLARVLPPISGQVLLNGKAVHQQPAKQVAKMMALLPQGPIAPEGLSVKELVSQGRYPHQSFLKQWSKEDEQAVNQAMQQANVEMLADRSIADLSGGQRQRCWIAMVLAQQTDIILLDEPTTYLDLKVQVDLLNLLSELAHQHQRTLVIVLHELNLAATYADHLIMMKDGNIYAQGTPEQVFNADNLQAVFGLNAKIIKDPDSRALVCIPSTQQPAQVVS
ncbi:cobalamin/Fe(3+)-siderophore ABC transporter ATP-binding protein [Psychromonas sp. B3M02]|uniref:ABC transporter ATP-binding protein n=1 Tax=Psychromonas sp. B3M02 TaxID=2267226 RepID=UPI000DE952B4|nr:ABC transporter ATP-binding protein [Psychromonas sp. B3M02]RBW47633.1 cobalamin/Fe(3+)-siderophore ABC transporter ATP-binding protein [Psychromonas sp. B3M02]